MPKHTTADRAKAHVVIVTLDNHITGAVARVNAQLARDVPGLTLSVHAASNWGANPDSLAACIEDIGKGDIVVAWAADAEQELRKVPFFVRGKARRNTEKFAADHGLAIITVETLYDAKAHFAR